MAPAGIPAQPICFDLAPVPMQPHRTQASTRSDAVLVSRPWQENALKGYSSSLEAKSGRVNALMAKLAGGERLEREEEIEMIRCMTESNDMWRATNLRLRFADDFQAVELFMLMEALLQQEGLSVDISKGKKRHTHRSEGTTWWLVR
ncbi:unnamed protein product [Prorocentrum cordatum]|uniref:Uncharacterized protein n=1 Tax=Prorocentrum cordatum TaxID=2364126 RepID=A0ABN9PKR9_9DINO|nr:unnamed protein product [Polarella glacialis]